MTHGSCAVFNADFKNIFNFVLARQVVEKIEPKYWKSRVFGINNYW